jgi:hypothetical protein
MRVAADADAENCRRSNEQLIRRSGWSCSPEKVERESSQRGLERRRSAAVSRALPMQSPAKQPPATEAAAATHLHLCGCGVRRNREFL